MSMQSRAIAHFHRGFARLLSIAGLALVLALPASAHDYEVGDLAIIHPWARATPQGARVGAGYMTIHNRGSASERLLSLTSEISERAEVHEMAMDDKGVMTMRALAGGVEIPAGGQVALKPGSYHIMFHGLKRPAKKGERFAATLIFETAGTVEIEFMVQEVAGSQPAHGHDG